MDWKEHFLNDLWPLLNDEQKKRLVGVAALLAQLTPVPADAARPTA